MDPLTQPKSVPVGPDQAYFFLVESFALSLRAQNRSPKTIQAYTDAARLFGAFLEGQGHSLALAQVRRADVERWMDALLHQPAASGGMLKPSTVHNRYRSLQQFFKWLVEVEQEIARSPMVGMKPPALPDEPPAVLSDDQLRKLLATCEKKTDFQSRRDYAILLILLDCGLRRSEIGGLALGDVDFDADPPTMRVLGKGKKVRYVPLGLKSALALRRYLRARLAHPDAADGALWLGRNGATTHWLIADVVASRGKEAGIAGLHPHLLRHTWAHLSLQNGAQTAELEQLGGWEPGSPMTAHYGRSAAGARARRAHRRFSPGDNL